MDDETNGPVHPERCYSNSTLHTCIERLRGDLRTSNHDKSVYRFEWNPLAAFR